MRLHVLSKAESGLEVSLQKRVGGLDVLDQLGVELDLGLFLLFDVLEIGFGFDFGFNEEVLSVDFLLGLFALDEVAIGDLAAVEAVNFDLGRGGDAVGLVDSSQRNTVDLVWAGDQK